MAVRLALRRIRFFACGVLAMDFPQKLKCWIAAHHRSNTGLSRRSLALLVIPVNLGFQLPRALLIGRLSLLAFFAVKGRSAAIHFPLDRRAACTFLSLTAIDQPLLDRKSVV